MSLPPKGSSQTTVRLKYGNKSLTDPPNIANSFNELFANIADARNITRGSNGTHDDDIKDFVNHRTQDSTTKFDIPPVTEGFLLKELQFL